jgi:hypothetical protein
MNPLIFGALLLAGSEFIKSNKASKIYDEKISEDSTLLNDLLEKKKLMYMKSGLKLTGSVLNDLETTKKKGYKSIDKLRSEKENFWISSIFGIPMQTYRYFGADYLKKNLFGKLK